MVAAAIVGVVVWTLPEGKPLPPENLRPAPPVKEEREVPLTPATRTAINRTLEQFIPAALTRREPAVAWEVAGPALRTGTSRRDWLRGELPVHPYPVRPQRLDGWRLIYSYRDQVALDLLVHPRPEARVGPIVFGIDLVRQKRRWLVNSVFPTAVFSDPDEPAWVTGPADFRAEASTAKSFYERKPDRARLSAAWLALPAALFASVLLIPIAFGIRSVVRDRRARARYLAARG